MTAKIKTGFVFVSIMLAILLILHCAKQPSFPVGIYATAITSEDLPATIPEEARTSLAGDWKITFGDNNRFSVSKSDELMAIGDFAVTDNQLTFKDSEGLAACPDPDIGIYTWVFDKNTMTFTTVEDSCLGRNSILTTHRWTKQE